MNIRREKLERNFAELLKRLAPEQRFMRLFREIVLHVLKQRKAASEGLLRAAKRKLSELGDRKNRLVDFLLQGRLYQRTYDEQILRLNLEVEEAERDLLNADMDSLDLEAVLNFAEKLVERPDQLWLSCAPEQKQRLQLVFFPEGLSITNSGFGTAATNSFFNLLSEFSVEKSHLACRSERF